MTWLLIARLNENNPHENNPQEVECILEWKLFFITRTSNCPQIIARDILGLFNKGPRSLLSQLLPLHHFQQ